MVEGHRSQSHHTPPQQTNPNQSRSQITCSSRRLIEESHHMHEKNFSFNHSPNWPEQAYALIDQSHPNNATSSNREKWEKGQRQSFRLFDAMRAHSRPQNQRAQALPRIFDTLEARSSQSKQETSPIFQPPHAELPVVSEPIGKAPLGFIS